MLREITWGDKYTEQSKNGDIVLKRRGFKICTWSYFPVKEYFKIIKLKSELYKSPLFYTIWN